MRRLSNLAMVCCGAVAMLAFSGASFAEEGAVTANVTNGKNIFENGKGDAVRHAKRAMEKKPWAMMGWVLPGLLT